MNFTINNSEKLQNCINHISNLPLDKGYHVTISNKKPRSLDQNALFHKWCDLIAKEAGTSPEEMKTAIKRDILGMKEIISPLTGEITYMDYSTANLTKEQFTRLMTHTQVLAMEYYGMTLPNKDDYESLQ